MALMNHLGTLRAINTYVGMAESTKRTHVALLAIFIKKAFHPGN